MYITYVITLFDELTATNSRTDIPPHIVHVISDVLSSSPGRPRARGVASFVSGLRWMGNPDMEVYQLILVVAKLMAECSGRFEAGDVDKSMRGLRGLSSDVMQVKELIHVLTAKIEI
jgi:hypothetical protein